MSNRPTINPSGEVTQSPKFLSNQTLSQIPAFVGLFGTNSNLVGVYPNDSVQLDIYNAAQQYLETNYRINNVVQDSNQITLDPEKDLSDLGYISGKYEILYKFNRNLLGSGDGHKLQIQEISADGLEIRLIPANSTTLPNADFLEFFSEGFFNIPKQHTLVNLFLYKDANTAMKVFDYVQDKFTFGSAPYSIIFKLNSPAPDGVNIGDLLWLTQQVSENTADVITITPPKLPSRKTHIAGPNWDAISKESAGGSTEYRDWDDLLSTNTQTSQDLINALLSGSLIEGIPLNIDYRRYENFVNFGSAAERLRNFKYKMQLLESYNARITELTTALSGLPSSSVSSSLYFQSNVVDSQNKRAALLGSFDGYEKYLYYESSSYVTNSFGEFYPTAWPKSNSTRPYTNYSYSSSAVDTWYEGALASASLFDLNNDKSLTKLLPNHVLLDDRNEEFSLFVGMIGHYFDLMYVYIKAVSDIQNRDQSILEGFSKELIYHVAKNLGVDFENGNSLEELWNYTLGTNTTGSLISTTGASTQDKTKETWKRIINNLPYLLKTKGTERGVRALINCFGIPQTILRIREYGGAEPDFDTKTDLQYERFNYALQVGYSITSSLGYYGSGVYGTASYAPTSPVEALYVPWKKLENNLFPSSVQLRFKIAEDAIIDQTIMEVPNQWRIRAFKSGSDSYIGFFLSGSSGWASSSVSASIYDSTFHSLTIQRSVDSDVISTNQTYDLIVKKVAYDKVVATYTSSLVINGATSSSYNNTFVTAGNLWVPGSGSFTFAQSNSIDLLSGSIQEFRLWTTALNDDVLNNHALAPTSFQGNTDEVYTGSTSSFYDLAFRLCLGSDNKKIDFAVTTSYSSQHPDQTTKFYDGSAKLVTFNSVRAPLYEPVVERHSLEWPDLGGNRSVSNKIRIDTTTRISNQLFRNSSVERATSDNNPPDSSRLGVFLSPTNEINQDIAEQFGGISIDDYIGNPSDLSLETYPSLESLQREYNKKYTRKNNAQNYIRLLQYYDAALFKLIKKFVPYRANTQVGLVIEPDLLHRSKLPTKLPTTENEYYTASLTLPDVYTPGGFVQDGDGEPFRNGSGYVQEATIGGSENTYLEISGDGQQIIDETNIRSGLQWSPEFDDVPYDMVVIDGTQIVSPLVLRGNANEFNNTGVADSPSQSGSLTGEVDLGVSRYGRDVRVNGSQYIFMSYATSGSGPTRSEPYMITSSRYDYHEPFGITVLDNSRSQTSNLSRFNYDVDIFGGKAFSDYTTYSDTAVSNTVTTYTSSAAIYQNRWTSQYGLTIVSLRSGSVSYDPLLQTTNIGYWELRGSGAPTAQGLVFNQTAPSGRPVTASVKLPAFFYDVNDPTTYGYLYKVTISTDESGVGVDNRLELHFGDLDCGLTGSVTPTTTQTNITFTTKALGNWLGLRLYTAGATATSTWIPTLKVECLNYRAQVQDFHLHDSYGMRNARYDGCKLTAADFNVDSPDTVDGGPVVQITVGGGTQPTVSPTNRGNFSV